MLHRWQDERCIDQKRTGATSNKNEQREFAIVQKKKRENSIYFLTQAKMFTRRIYSG